MRREISPRRWLPISLPKFSKSSRRPFNDRKDFLVGFSLVDQYLQNVFTKAVDGNSTQFINQHQHSLLSFSSFPRNLVVTTAATSPSFREHLLLLRVGHRTVRAGNSSECQLLKQQAQTDVLGQEGTGPVLPSIPPLCLMAILSLSVCFHSQREGTMTFSCTSSISSQEVGL